jgi:hypothetical protein
VIGYVSTAALTTARHNCNNEFPSFAGLVSNAPQLMEADAKACIKSFAAGSVNGLDGLRPQHLKDLTSGVHAVSSDRLVSRSTEFAILGLRGCIPACVQPIFCGASLCALTKKRMMAFTILPLDAC